MLPGVPGSSKEAVAQSGNAAGTLRRPHSSCFPSCDSSPHETGHHLHPHPAGGQAGRTATTRTGSTAPYTPSPGRPHQVSDKKRDLPTDRHHAANRNDTAKDNLSAVFFQAIPPRPTIPTSIQSCIYLPARCRISFLRPPAVSRQETTLAHSRYHAANRNDTARGSG